MAKNRLNRKELDTLNWMTDAQKKHQFEGKSMEVYMELWKNEKLREKGIDTNAPHEINLETGVIRQVVEKVEDVKENGTEGH